MDKPSDERVVMIFAGYLDDMGKFLKNNDGFKHRIGYTFTFEDYTV